jgi:arylformamidase
MKTMNQDWIDISVPVRTGMVEWPGDASARVERTADMDKGAGCNVSSITLSSHTGTHMDAPLHFILGAPSLDSLDFSAIVGPARIIEISDIGIITEEHLHEHNIETGERVLLKTENSHTNWPEDGFRKDYVALNTGAARLLAEIGVRCIGVDYLSVGPFKGDGKTVHTTLLSAGIWIIEGLDLSNVTPGNYDLVCLPLRIENGDGSPARAILRRSD